jgi:hypothetical protein
VVRHLFHYCSSISLAMRHSQYESEILACTCDMSNNRSPPDKTNNLTPISRRHRISLIPKRQIVSTAAEAPLYESVEGLDSPETQPRAAANECPSGPEVCVCRVVEATREIARLKGAQSPMRRLVYTWQLGRRSEYAGLVAVSQPSYIKLWLLMRAHCPIRHLT